MLAGDRLRTERGRAEILFADGSALDVDQYSSVDLLSDSLTRLLTGRVRLSLSRPSSTAPGLDYRVDAAPASVLIRTAGDYRLELSDARGGAPELDLAVLRGAAELQNAFGRTLVRAGTHARASARAEPSLPYAFNSAAWDAFDRWAEDQRDARYGVSSSRYLPADLRYYGGTLDRAGAWSYEPAYGYVWYPRVDPFWRPYYSGRWSFVTRIGWLWIGVDRWAWPTHHYGRWGFNTNRWFWIPDRRWSPAWVSWAVAPGYVSWCPLGFDGRPVISVTNISYRSGWTVLPARVFTPNVVVTHHVVDPRDLSPYVRNALTVRSNAPVAVSAARSAPPLRAPGVERADGRTGNRPAPADQFRGSAVPRADAPPGSMPSRSYGAMRSAPAPSTTSPTAPSGSWRYGSEPPPRGAGASRVAPEPAQHNPGPARVEPGRQRVDPAPTPSRGESRAEPRQPSPPPPPSQGRSERGDGRSSGRGDSAPSSNHDSGGPAASGGRERPHDAPSENRAVPRRGRG